MFVRVGSSYVVSVPTCYELKLGIPDCVVMGWDYSPASVGLVSDPSAAGCDNVFASPQDDASLPPGSVFGAWEHPEPYIVTDLELSSVHLVVVMAWVFSFSVLCLVAKCFFGWVGALA